MDKNRKEMISTGLILVVIQLLEIWFVVREKSCKKFKCTFSTKQKGNNEKKLSTSLTVDLRFNQVCISNADN